MPPAYPAAVVGAHLRRAPTSPSRRAPTVLIRSGRRLAPFGALLLLLLGLAVRPTPAQAAFWVPDTSRTTAGLAGVACGSPGFCKAVGFDGTIRSWNGTSWSADTSGTAQLLLGVACASPSLCKAVGEGGTILSWNGRSWSPDTSGLTGTLRGVACLAPSFCKAVGFDGTIVSLLAPSGGASISDISPTSGPVAGGTFVTIGGYGFKPGARVFFDGVEAPFVYVPNTRTLAVRTPAHAAGPVTVTLRNLDGSGATLPNGFTFVP